MRALVLSGGGAKGSYQIGVWKALRKLGIKIDIVTGSSIGSINAAMFVQNRYFTTNRMWKKMKTNDLFDIENSNYKDYFKLLSTFIKEGGMSFSKAEVFLRKFINEKRVRKSKIDYGLVTYSLTTKKPRMLSKNQIPEGQLLDYIVASSTCYPAAQKKVIDGNEYIDGGFYDNMPINLAIDMGADEVIAVDLNVIGKNQKVKDKNVKIDVIKCSDSTKFTLSFDKKNAKEMIKMGYYDTLKHFGKLDGNDYTFRKNDLIKNYNRIKKYYIDILKDLLLTYKKGKIVTEIFNITKYRKLFDRINNKQDIDDVINHSLEYLGNLFNLPNNKVYKIDEYNKLLLKEVKKLDYLKLDKSLKGKMLVGYIYNKFINANDKDVLSKEIFNIALIFQKEFLATVYLISISDKYSYCLKNDKFYSDVFSYLKENKDK